MSATVIEGEQSTQSPRGRPRRPRPFARATVLRDASTETKVPTPASVAAVFVPAGSATKTGGEKLAAPPAPLSDWPEAATEAAAAPAHAIAPEFIIAYDKFIREQPADQYPVSFEEFVRLREMVKAYEIFRRQQPPDEKPICFEEYLRRRAHEDMRDSLKQALEQFLAPLVSDFASEQHLQQLLRDDFLPTFIAGAGELAERCCRDFAEIIHRASHVADVRQTAQIVRARRVRDEAFGRLDQILQSLSKAPERIRELADEVDRTISRLHASDSPAEVLRAAVTAELNGTVSIPQLATALVTAEAEASRQLSTVRQQQKTLLQAKNAAYSLMKEYLGALGTLPGAMLEYACSKCYGGDVDFSLEREAVLRVEEAVAPQLAAALELLNALSGAAERQLDRQREAEIAKMEEQRHAAVTKIHELERRQYQTLGYQAMGFGAVCLLAAILSARLSAHGDPAVIGLRVLAALAAMVFFAWGFSAATFGHTRSKSRPS